MSLKRMMTAVLCAASLYALAAEASAVSAPNAALAGAICDVLKNEKLTPEAIAADPAAAVRQLKERAGKDAQAAGLYGICLKDGFGVQRSIPEARKLFLQAAGKGDALGQFWGGWFLLRGEGGPADPVKGVDLLESAAVQGLSDAMLLLSRIYLEGYVVNGKVIIREDHPLALRYLRRAAAGGNRQAALAIGDWYLKGGPVQPDVRRAIEWFKQAQGVPGAASALAEAQLASGAPAVREDALARLAILSEEGDPRARTFMACRLFKETSTRDEAMKLIDKAVAAGYPPAMTAKARFLRTQGDKSYPAVLARAAEAGDPEAMAEYGFILATTARGAQSGKGLDLLERAARRGVLEGQVKLGRIYLQGRLVPRDEEKAFDMFRTAAAKGSVEAKYFLAVCLSRGLGCKADPERAAAAAREAADAGDSYAQLLYGTFLRDGIGVAQDSTAALNYFDLSAKQGNPHAKTLLADLISKAGNLSPQAAESGVAMVQKSAEDGDASAAYSLGRMYTEGTKLPRDYALGRKNLELAVSKKYAPAYARLADYYLNGWGVKQDFKKADQLLREGSALRNGDAVCRMGLCKFNGVGTAKDLPGAVRLFNQAASLGCAEGDLWLGVAYAQGKGVAANEKTAYAHYRRAAMRGNDTALFLLALCYKDGLGVARNAEVAFTYLKQAADAGNSNAMYELGLMYANGVRVAKDIPTAVSYYRKAAEAGNTYGVYELGCCYESGRGVEKDLRRAVSLYRIAADGGNRYAQFTLGRCYEGGIGVPQDKYEALKWYRKAAAGGFKYAQVRAQKLKEEIDHIIL